jgi:polysaccharide export outer membrane protein
MEALAMAGDILPSGRKEDVLLVRQDENRRTYTLLDLTRQDIFRSPHFTLKQNDMIVVQANKLQQNMAFTMRQQYLGLAVSVASILVLLFNLIINL